MASDRGCTAGGFYSNMRLKKYGKERGSNGLDTVATGNETKEGI